jgi:hypothetical protein
MVTPGERRYSTPARVVKGKGRFGVAVDRPREVSGSTRRRGGTAHRRIERLLARHRQLRGRRRRTARDCAVRG